jgi:hypothetical protein
MLNSSNYVRDEQTLNSGQEVLPDFADKNAKHYRHSIPGAKSIMPDGAELVFRGGSYATTNPDIIAFLDRIADKPGTMVTTKKVAVIAELAAAAQDAAMPAGDAEKLGQAATPEMVAATQAGVAVNQVKK